MASLNSIPSGKSFAVLIHGCHLQAQDWERIVGGSEDQAGRAQTGVKEAVWKRAKLIFWGTGASQTSDGTKESEYTYKKVVGEWLDKIAQYVKKDPEELKKYLEKVSVIDNKTQNTTQEIEACINLCQDRKIKKLVLVSSPEHITRCHNEALKYLDNFQVKEGKKCPIKIYALASDTHFHDATPAKVTILEPPHRGDMPPLPPFHETTKQFFQFYKYPEIAIEFHKELLKLISKHKAELNQGQMT